MGGRGGDPPEYYQTSLFEDFSLDRSAPVHPSKQKKKINRNKKVEPASASATQHAGSALSTCRAFVSRALAWIFDVASEGARAATVHLIKYAIVGLFALVAGATFAALVRYDAFEALSRANPIKVDIREKEILSKELPPPVPSKVETGAPKRVPDEMKGPKRRRLGHQDPIADWITEIWKAPH